MTDAVTTILAVSLSAAASVVVTWFYVGWRLKRARESSTANAAEDPEDDTGTESETPEFEGQMLFKGDYDE